MLAKEHFSRMLTVYSERRSVTFTGSCIVGVNGAMISRACFFAGFELSGWSSALWFVIPFTEREKLIAGLI